MKQSIWKSLKNISVSFLAILVVCITAYGLGVFDSWNNQLTDRLFTRQPQPQNIIIVAIDDRSLTEIGQWPWKRESFGALVTKLNQAKAIGIDINFSEPSRFGSSDDQQLRTAFDQSKAPLILPVEVDPAKTAANKDVSIGKNNIRVVGDNVVVKPQVIFTESKLVRTGIVNVETDNDSGVRSIPFDFRVNNSSNTAAPLFAEAIFNSSHSEALNYARIGTKIAYQGPAQTFITVSASDVISGKIDPAFFKDSYVLVGATALNLRDLFKTPFGTIPGVEIHANILHTFLSGQQLSPISKQVGALYIFLIALLTCLTVWLIKRVRYLAAALGVLFVAIILFSILSFNNGVILPLIYFLFTFGLTLAVTLIHTYVKEAKEKSFIKQSFQYYLSPEVVSELTQNPDKLKLGGEKRELTILFSDIRGFTSISEKLSPEGLVELMNEYLTVMTDIIMKHGGLVDKYIGDAIMAFWGAPLSNKDHAKAALSASKEMMKKLHEMNGDFEKKGWPPIAIGIGLNTGEVIVGNMGSHKRFNYTIMGDEVNFASRLEGLTKQYGICCLASESTIKRGSESAGGAYASRKLDSVMVKGKKEPKIIYELVDDEVKTPEALRELFTHAYVLYTQGKFADAITAFKAILEKYPDDEPTKVFLHRSEEFEKNPPLDWKGVYEFKTK